MKILFVDLTEGHNPHTINDKPTGGTLTSLTKVTEYLASVGYEVYVSSKFDSDEIVNGVRYLKKGSQAPVWDVTIFNRNVLPKDFVNYCKNNGSKIIWWLHDIVDNRYLPDDTFKLADKIVALSNYCKETYADFYEIDKDKIRVISNGIDPKIYYPGEYENRNPHVYLTASALVKGFIPIPLTYDSLKSQDPDIDFRIYSSQKLHGIENNNVQNNYLDFMGKSGAHVYHPVGQKALATIMRKAWALLMPNSYPEICSNLLLQARACGLPIVSSQIGANAEFIEHEKTGLLTNKWTPHDIHSWTIEFARETCRLQKDTDLHRKISLGAPLNVPTWEGIGNDWHETIQALFK